MKQGPPSALNVGREGTATNEEKKHQDDEALRKRIREMVRESIMGTNGIVNETQCKMEKNTDYILGSQQSQQNLSMSMS